MNTNQTDGEPALREKFVKVLGERYGDDGYIIHGLPPDQDFRDEGNYGAIKCSSLKVEGVGFAAESFEFSEYQTLIVVTQQNTAGLTNITFEEI